MPNWLQSRPANTSLCELDSFSGSINPKTFSLPIASQQSFAATAESIPPLMPIIIPRFVKFSKTF